VLWFFAFLLFPFFLVFGKPVCLFIDPARMFCLGSGFIVTREILMGERPEVGVVFQATEECVNITGFIRAGFQGVP